MMMSTPLSDLLMDILMFCSKNKIIFELSTEDGENSYKINILNASIQAMQLALDGLSNPFKHILVDGNRFKPYKDIPYTTVVKGDGKYKSIAAASILAKTHRDELMEKLNLEFPEYAWGQNKGYPTSIHRAAIAEYGSNIHHRKSFTLLAKQIPLF